MWKGQAVIFLEMIASPEAEGGKRKIFCLVEVSILPTTHKIKLPINK